MGRAMGPLYDRDRLFRPGGCEGNLLAPSITHLWGSVLLCRIWACPAGCRTGLGERAQRSKEGCRGVPQGISAWRDRSPAAIIYHSRRKVRLRRANPKRGGRSDGSSDRRNGTKALNRVFEIEEKSCST